jgi:hypothetical protein
MVELRNPFRVRTSEHIDSDATFLRLFSPEVLKLLLADELNDGLWDRIQFFQSAPGGGKTSLFRVFTPTVLHRLHESKRSEPKYKDLYQSMASLDAVAEEEGPLVLGVMISCARNYATLDDLPFDAPRRERLLYALLNARLMMAGLRGALALRGLSFPEDLPRLSISPPEHGELPTFVELPATGETLFSWARSLERRVFEAIDSFGPADDGAVEGHDALHVPGLLRPAVFQCDGAPVAQRTVIMLDDLHRLTSSQREKLTTSLAELRTNIGVWLAERLEVLRPEELLAPSATDGREYGHSPINLERFWGATPARFKRAMMDVAGRRVKLSRGTRERDSFESCLEDGLDVVARRTDLVQAAMTIKSRVLDKIATHEARGAISQDRFAAWINTLESETDSEHQAALRWRGAEILIERDLSRAQQTLDFGGALPDAMLSEKEGDVRPMAEYFLAREFDLPYYYGTSTLASLATWNIEQFLSLSGDLFEEVVSADLINKSFVALSPARQDAILRSHARRRWKELPKRTPHGRDVQRLLQGIGHHALGVTLQPKASYKAVTGVAMKTRDRMALIEKVTHDGRTFNRRLVEALSSAMAHNLLVAKTDHQQGQKGQSWTVLYLNRWLCLYFGLPIQYGGWRPVSTQKLNEWLRAGASFPKTLLSGQ